MIDLDTVFHEEDDRTEMMLIYRLVEKNVGAGDRKLTNLLKHLHRATVYSLEDDDAADDAVNRSLRNAFLSLDIL